MNESMAVARKRPSLSSEQTGGKIQMTAAIRASGVELHI